MAKEVTRKGPLENSSTHAWCKYILGRELGPSGVSPN